jgi:hypothetical protein
MDELQVRAGEEFMHFTLDYMALWFLRVPCNFFMEIAAIHLKHDKDRVCEYFFQSQQEMLNV